MTKTLFADTATLMSPRTTKYFEAMVREGDTFNYNKWLKRIREEEAQAKQDQAAITPGELIAAQVNDPIRASDFRDRRPFKRRALIGKAALGPRALRWQHRQTPKARLRRWLEKIHRAWGEFQASRARDAVYDYLTAVFGIVMHYKVRRRTDRLLRHAFEFASLPIDRKADPYTGLIRCTCDNTADAKMISKWARALRYASRRKEPDARLKTFMKEVGGVNACANRYAKRFGRGRRR